MILEIGNPISKELSTLLKKYTTNDDRANVVLNTKGCGTSTLREVVYRNNPVTESSSKVVLKLIGVAVKNAKKEMESSIEAVSMLEGVTVVKQKATA